MPTCANYGSGDTDVPGAGPLKERLGEGEHVAQMIALQYHEFGEPVDVVRPQEVPSPQPGPGEIRLRLLRSPIHNHDLATIRGLYGVKPKLPATGGTELLGVVDELGTGVTNLQKGQRVVSMVQGAWAEHSIAQAAQAVPIPDGISADLGAQLLAMPLSAVVLFDGLQLQRGDWIVQNAAGGAVASTLRRLAARAGVNVVNLVRREAAADDLRAAGAQYVVATQGGDWPARVRAIAGDRPIVRAIDSVCDATSMALHRLLAPDGELVVFGALGGTPLMLDPGALIFGETKVRGFWMTRWMSHAGNAERIEALQRVFALALSGDLSLPVCGVFALQDAAQALKQAETPGRPGKVLLTV